MDYFRLFHMLGIVFWSGSAVAVALAAASTQATTKGDHPVDVTALRNVVRFVSTPAMILAFGGGLGMLLPNFSAVYAKAGWMHGKLTLIIVLAGLTGALGAKLRKAGGKPAQEVALAGKRFTIAILIVTALIIGLAVLRPGS